MISKSFWLSLILALLFLPLSGLGALNKAYFLRDDPADQNLYDKYRNAVLYYYGVTGDSALLHILKGQFKRYPEYVQSLEYTHTLPRDNRVRRFFCPIVGVVQLNANVTIRNGRYESTIYELDPYISFRWANWPWNHYLMTSLAVGEGISYASSVPAVEKKDNNNTKRLLNYLMLEATFAAPAYPRLQLVARIHHRSGAFGLYGANNTGSNVVGLGLRYLFD